MREVVLIVPITQRCLGTLGIESSAAKIAKRQSERFTGPFQANSSARRPGVESRAKSRFPSGARC